MNFALLPEKHVRTSESLLGLGAVVLAAFEGKPKNIDSFWRVIKEVDTIKPRIYGTITLDQIIITVDFLFAVGAITLNSKGQLEYASY